jgi:hypothetical protein
LEAAPDLIIVSWLSGLPKLDTEERLEAASSASFEGDIKLSFSQLAGVAGRDDFVCLEGVAAAADLSTTGSTSTCGM